MNTKKINYLSVLLLAIGAGIAIGIGGFVYLSVDNKIVGACLFAVGLYAVCTQGLFLYTGKIGYLMGSNNKKQYGITLAITFIGNYIGAMIPGIFLSRFVYDKVALLANAKTQYDPLTLILLGVFCGLLMYVAVDGYKKTNNPIILIMCVAAFILSGFEHCVADMFYLTAAKINVVSNLSIVLLVAIGNTIGGLIIPLLQINKLFRLYRSTQERRQNDE